MHSIVIYPLSADPFTLGHKNVVERTAQLFPDREIHVIVADNRDKKHFFSIEERISIVEASLGKLIEKNVQVLGFDGILSDYATENEAGVIIRGIRNATDLDYEFKLEQFTRNTCPAETVYLTPLTDHLNTSSSLLRMFLQSGNTSKAEEFMDDKGFERMKEIIRFKSN